MPLLPFQLLGVPFIPAYRNRVHLTFLSAFLFPILFNSVQKHLVICARLSLIGHSRFTGKGIRKEYNFFFKGVNKYLSNIFYKPGTMKVSVEPPMNKIGLVPDLISLKMLW